jgi:hypothetical protein
MTKQPVIKDGKAYCPDCGGKLDHNNVTGFWVCNAPRDIKVKPHGPTRYGEPVCSYQIVNTKVDWGFEAPVVAEKEYSIGYKI